MINKTIEFYFIEKFNKFINCYFIDKIIFELYDFFFNLFFHEILLNIDIFRFKLKFRIFK